MCFFWESLCQSCLGSCWLQYSSFGFCHSSLSVSWTFSKWALSIFVLALLNSEKGLPMVSLARVLHRTLGTHAFMLLLLGSSHILLCAVYFFEELWWESTLRRVQDLLPILYLGIALGGARRTERRIESQLAVCEVNHAGLCHIGIVLAGHVSGRMASLKERVSFQDSGELAVACWFLGIIAPKAN